MEITQLEQDLKKVVLGEVRFYPYSRALYSSDASIYQIELLGVVIPRNKEDGIATVEIVVTGASCRQQIQDGTGRKPRHLAEILVEALV